MACFSCRQVQGLHACTPGVRAARSSCGKAPKFDQRCNTVLLIHQSKSHAFPESMCYATAWLVFPADRSRACMHALHVCVRPARAVEKHQRLTRGAAVCNECVEIPLASFAARVNTIVTFATNLVGWHGFCTCLAPPRKAESLSPCYTEKAPNACHRRGTHKRQETPTKKPKLPSTGATCRPRTTYMYKQKGESCVLQFSTDACVRHAHTCLTDAYSSRRVSPAASR